MSKLNELISVLKEKNLEFCLRTDEKHGFMLHVHKPHPDYDDPIGTVLLQYCPDIDALLDNGIYTAKAHK